MPIIDAITTYKTQFYQFSGIIEDEETIKGTYWVHEKIYIDELGLNAPPDPITSSLNDFRNRLFLAYGDQLTAARIWSVKAQQKYA